VQERIDEKMRAAFREQCWGDNAWQMVLQGREDAQRMYWYRMFPQKKEVGGRGTILVQAVDVDQCSGGWTGDEREVRVYTDEYRNEGSEGGMVAWDECLSSKMGF
jgi:hypothetical protein